jgi:hypothetical protein
MRAAPSTSYTKAQRLGGFGPRRAAIDKVEALRPRHIVAGHQNKELDSSSAIRTTSAGRSCGVGTSVLYGVREHPEQDVRLIIVGDRVQVACDLGSEVLVDKLIHLCA